MAKKIIRATRGGALLGAFCLLFSTLASAPVQSAEVTDVRIGVHPDYTRMVFELDRPASYRVLRGSGRTEVLIALKAHSIPRRIESEKSLVSLIEFKPTAAGSEARISLVREGLSLKEMVLVDPPRIVLDILGTKPSAVPPATLKKPTAAKTPRKTKSTAATPTPAASKPKRQAKAVQKPSSKPSSKPKPAKVIAANSRPSRPVIRVEAPPKQSPPAPRRKSVTSPSLAQGAKPDRTLAKVSAPGIKPVSAAQAGQAPEEEASESTAWAKQLLAVVGLVALVALVGVWGLIRRRRRPVSGEVRDEGLEVAPETSNPFAVLEPPEAEETEAVTAGIEPELDFAAAVDEAMGGETIEADSEQALFDELPLGAALSTESDQAPDPGLDPGPEIVEPAPLESAPGEVAQAMADPIDLHEAAVEAAAAAPVSDPYEADRVAGREAAEETLSLVRDLEERVAGLQGQLEVALESRERIERQMAAQNEELRVQRAAIARTQRAVRNISRPEEGSHGETTTPPAD